jgi:EAL domain-containing protein (putative c-di-GMP-specific phosphodiesterase class I)
MLYNEQLGERARRDARIATRLRLALQNNGLDLHYQPQVDIRTGEVHSFEALLRWSDAELGAVSPAQFVPVAEHAGLMPALGEVVLQLACQQLQCWRQAGFAARVAVNLSPLQFRDELLAERIVEELRQRNLPCESLCVEVTESAMMDDPAAAAAQLQRLADAGIEVHLDDFGTGHSSLAWLKDFPIRSIKIDRGFVRNMLADGNDDAIVRAVIGLAHTLGCKVIAEGVEEPEQLQRLNALGCDLYQGWLFSKALPAGEARKLASGREN